MKIKHWQGYGCVNAKKISSKSNNGEMTTIIKVTGNHECGLIRNDKYDAYNWLLKRFDKNITDYRKIKQLECISEPSDVTGNSEDSCTYVFHYNMCD